MTSYNKTLWQTVVYLFLSKIVKQANVSFPQDELINTKNIDLAKRFTQMVGDTTDEKKIKFALLKGLRQLEEDSLVLRLDEKTLQLSPDGFAKMKLEVETAMMKIAQSFPESVPKDNSGSTVQ
ncbi:hypothetical protein SAMN05660420_02036 [Desulfuromusa kysingii]|uniref:Uncharacterized protein n=1 Tax=Desulfuromusa kysingii TaxID=37625 RepID=A0A1H4AYW3_9BACT|nr:hypothetical protein [Desulfuromusa kysingii]SEA40842.1 hypothetical protein SAMN05660420_02036 [Desulfuromusa kysingii]